MLAGGLGTRLKSVVPDLPKPMAPVSGRPFLEILLTLLSRKGFSRVILSLGFMADRVVSYFGTRFGSMELAYEIESSPLGTGGALKRALLSCREDHVFVFNGDTFLDVEIEQVQKLWVAHGDPIVVVVSVPDTARYGRVTLSDDLVVGFEEKGATGQGFINAGCYALPVGIFSDADVGQCFSLESDFLKAAVHKRPFRAFVSSHEFIDIGVPEDYLRAQRELGERLPK